MITTAGYGKQGGVGLVVQNQPQVWSVERMHFHRPNVDICKVIKGKKRTLIVNAYLSPYTSYHVLFLEEAMTPFYNQ